jgi:hypothetical protein
MQVKTIMSYNFHTHRMVTCFFKKSENNSCWWGCRNTGTLFTLLVSMVALTEVFWSGVCVVSECHGRQFFFFFFWWDLDFSPTTWATPPAHFVLVILEMKSFNLFARTGLETRSSRSQLPKQLWLQEWAMGAWLRIGISYLPGHSKIISKMKESVPSLLGYCKIWS